jgi:ankyrin repeat protein
MCSSSSSSISITNSFSALKDLIEKGDVQKLSRRIEDNDEAFDTKDSNMRTLLHIAAECNQAACFKLLLNSNIPWVRDKKEYTPLGAAARSGCRAVLEVIFGTEAQKRLAKKLTRESVLQAAGDAAQNCHLECLTFLLNQAVLNNNVCGNTDSQGNSLMHRAVLGGCLSCIEELRNRGLRVTHKNFDYETPFHLAARAGNCRILQNLYQGNSREGAQGINMYGELPLHLAVKANCEDCVRYLITCVPGTLSQKLQQPTITQSVHSFGSAMNTQNFLRGATPLHYALYFGHYSVAIVLLNKGARHGSTACYKGEDVTPYDLLKTRTREFSFEFQSRIVTEKDLADRFMLNRIRIPIVEICKESDLRLRNIICGLLSVDVVLRPGGRLGPRRIDYYVIANIVSADEDLSKDIAVNFINKLIQNFSLSDLDLKLIDLAVNYLYQTKILERLLQDLDCAELYHRKNDIKDYIKRMIMAYYLNGG